MSGTHLKHKALIGIGKARKTLYKLYRNCCPGCLLFLIKIEIRVIIELHPGNSQYLYAENGNKSLIKDFS